MTSTDSKRNRLRRPIIEALAALALLALAFAGIAASDVSAASSYGFWLVLVLIYAAAALISDRLHSEHSMIHLRSAVSIALHWAAVLAAVSMIFFFVSSGRIANADTGLTCGAILSLGTFTAGAQGNWRMMLVGVTLAAATIGVAVVEEYLWILLGLAVAAAAVLVLGAHFMRKRGAGAS